MQKRLERLVSFFLLLVWFPSLGAEAVEERVATFAGGCFWCVEADFDYVPGVIRTTSGYTGGTLENPTYRKITKGGTGHREAVQIHYDANHITYAELLEIFWRSVDPTDKGGQFCDRGESYQTTIFVATDEQRRLAQASKARIDSQGILGAPIVTTIEKAGKFYLAEEYHQDYYLKNPVRYKFYRVSCGRDRRIERLWGEEAHRGIEKL